MKRIDNPRRNINIPDVADWFLNGIGGLDGVGDAVLAVDLVRRSWTMGRCPRTGRFRPLLTCKEG
jgi:hypothetical protein